MISVVFWVFYAGACIAAGQLGWSIAKKDKEGLCTCVAYAIATALFAPLLVGVAAAAIILRPVFRP